MNRPDPIRELDAALQDRYRVEREVGRGGMATVYLAHDVKHERDVALKVLRPELAARLGTERFLKEIKVTANLQHPGILPLFDSGEAGGFLYYVMPFVRGETLRERLERGGPLDIGTAVEIGRDVALALHHAHRKGVVHRDIKPGNILLHEGRALVADFGIALAVEEAGADRLTGTGHSLGTPAYMSPEQVSGDRDLDARSDVYSLGSVVYEMLTGEPPHTGSSAQAIVARILAQEPAPVTSLRPTVPEHLESAVSRALAKVPADRWPSAADFAEALSSEGSAVPSAGGPFGRPWLKVAGGGLVAAAVVAVAVLAMNHRRSGAYVDPTTLTSEQVTDFLGREHGAAWSPDGSMITYSYTMEGHSDVFVMSVPDGDPLRLTEHPADDDLPRWSPTGEWIAFLSDRGTGLDLMLVAPTGGRVRKVASTNTPGSEDPAVWFWGLGADPWSPDGRLLLFPRRDAEGRVGIWSVDIESGELNRLTTPPPGSQDLSASWSPDGRRIAFGRGYFGNGELWLMSADGSGARPLTDDLDWAFYPAWTPDGEGLVFAADFNLWARRVSGEPRALTRGFHHIYGVDVGPAGAIAYSITPHLTNLYEGAPGTPPEEHEQLTRDTRDQYGTRVAPDGRRVVYMSDRAGTMDVWVYDRETGEDIPLTDGPALDQMPEWLPGGGVVFVSNRGEGVEDPLWMVPAEGGEPRRFATGVPPIVCGIPYCRKGPNVSPDGRLVGFVGAGEDRETLWVVNVDGTDPRPTDIPQVKSFDWYRDSRRVVYTTTLGDGSGRIEMRARHLDTGEDVLLVRRSATEPEVAPDGRSVAFLHAASHYDMNAFLLGVEPPDGPGGLPRAAGEPESLIDGQGVWHVHNFDWTPDGRFIYTRDEDEGDIFVLRPEES